MANTNLCVISRYHFNIIGIDKHRNSTKTYGVSYLNELDIRACFVGDNVFYYAFQQVK